jgi:hypothetical protein
MGSPRELVRLCRGVIPRRMMALPRRVRALNARTRVRAGTGVHAREASSEAEADPRTGRSPLEGGVDPRARRGLLEGALDWATLLGRGGRHGVGRALGACLSEGCFAFVFCRF